MSFWLVIPSLAVPVVVIAERTPSCGLFFSLFFGFESSSCCQRLVPENTLKAAAEETNYGELTFLKYSCALRNDTEIPAL